jgi:tetratricopeptide (TPR) repeat protein
MSDVYINLHGDDSDEFVSTIRLTFQPKEAVKHLLTRCAHSTTCDPPLTVEQISMLQGGGFQLSLDDATPMSQEFMGDENPGDLFGLVAPPVNVYVHGTSSLRSVDPTLEELSTRVPVLNGRTIAKDLLVAFASTKSTSVELSYDDEGVHRMEGRLLTTPLQWVVEGADFFVVAAAHPDAVKIVRTSNQPRWTILTLPHDAAESVTMEELSALVVQSRTKQCQRKAIDLCLAAAPRLQSTLGGAAVSPLYMLLADLYVDAKKRPLAVDALRKVLSLSSSSLTSSARCKLNKKIAMLLFDEKRYEEARDVFSSCIEENTISKDEIVDLRIRLGGCHFMLGDEDKGIAMVQGTLAGDLKNNQGVYWMAMFYVKRGLVKDAVSWAVQLVVRAHSDTSFGPQAKHLLVHVFRAFGSDQCLKEINDMIQVPKEPNADLASVVGYLALVARDHSIMDLAISLYRRALEICSTPLMALNYIHTLENDGRIYEALTETKKYLEGLGALSVGNVSARQVARLLGPLDDEVTVFPVPARVALERLRRPRSFVRVHADETVTAHSDATAAQALPLGSLPPKNDASTAPSPYDSQKMQLEILGIFFAAVKNCFLLGLLHLIPDLLVLINPLHKGHALHKTIMRNEAAYFASIALLMQHLDPDTTSQYDRDAEALYVVGDSHTLSPSWHSITLRGKPYLLVCGVVTGLKIWHLRESSDFYPKHLYHRITSAIPAASRVMLILGEIDCREGIFQTVEKGVYSSISEACAVLGNIYTSAVKSVVQRRQLPDIIVHSPPPSLDVTRPLVLQLTGELERQFRALRDPSIVFTVVPVLSADGMHLLPQYALDQTHLSPLYVFDGLLRRSIESALPLL